MNERQDQRPRQTPDPHRIDIHQQRDLRYWTETLGVSEARLKETVEHVGPTVGAVRNALGR